MQDRTQSRPPSIFTIPARSLASGLIVGLLLIAHSAWGATAKEIDVSVDVALERFQQEVGGGKAFLEAAKGVLVFPSVFKAGFGIGREYGEGVLRIGGKTVDYDNLVAVSFGFQLGDQVKSVLLAFMDQDALDHFRTSQGWKVGADASVALITKHLRDPLVPSLFPALSALSRHRRPE